MANQDVPAVVTAARQLLGPPGEWFFPGGYRDSLAHAVIDSVYSLRSKYGVVANVRARYDELRKSAGGDPVRDGVAQLVEAIDNVGGPEAAAPDLFRNQNKAPGTKRLKSVAVYDAARALQNAGVHNTSDLREAAEDADRLAEVRRSWTQVVGLGKASWDYLLMLAGVDGTKPDVMTRRFVTDAVNADSMVTPERASAAIRGAAEILEVPMSTLDHTIWRYQSGRMAGPGEINVD